MLLLVEILKGVEVGWWGGRGTYVYVDVDGVT